MARPISVNFLGINEAISKEEIINTLEEKFGEPFKRGEFEFKRRGKHLTLRGEFPYLDKEEVRDYFMEDHRWSDGSRCGCSIH